MPFVKRGPAAELSFEAAGLRWLGAADAVRVVQPESLQGGRLSLPRIRTVSATSAAAQDFGRSLAALHAAGAPGHGCAPPGWEGDGCIAGVPLPLTAEEPAWGEFYAGLRVLPLVRLAHDAGDLDDVAVFEQLAGRLCDGDFGDEPASRLHGDLWSGNVLWSPDGVVLIDPAAHGGHRETDLAMLALFGLPQLQAVLSAYDEAHPLADGWRERVPLHQVFPLLVHTVKFGRSYASSATAAARAML